MKSLAGAEKGYDIYVQGDNRATEALRPELARRLADIRERYLDVQIRHNNNGYLQSEDRVWALDTIKYLADTVDALLAEIRERAGGDAGGGGAGSRGDA